ncbi:TPA: minichromosome maintenance protein MCM [Candidatus Woesearchaeota archaeon]|nr:minichromosome maintenance protein MCM [Candidatus Woesearchaeota archaeon]
METEETGLEYSPRAQPQYNALEHIRKFKELIEASYYSELLKNVRKGDKLLAIAFPELSKFDPDLATDLLDNPEEVIKAAELAVQQFDLGVENGSPLVIRVRFSQLPPSQSFMIRNIRSAHLNKMIVIEGVVRQKSDVRPQVTASKFECPACGNVINVLQLDTTFREPSKCGCGRKGKFLMLSNELVDAQGIVVEESPEVLEGGDQPKRINVLLKNDLVSPLSERRTSPGSKVIINGIVKEVPIISRTGAKLTRFDLHIDANYVESSQESFYEVELTDEDIAVIKDIAEDPRGYEKIIASMAPSIYGYEKIKESLMLQMMGGVRKVRNDKVVSRGDMHILLVGDPGAGKSQLLKRVATIAPKSRYVSGKGASGAGLTASVVRDEFLKGWALEAGALVLASDGICCIDELDKMGVEDRAAMHEALEQQTVSVSKANVQATLIARATVLAAANPKFGRFDPFDIIANQIDLPPTLINRFDLIFPIKDLPDGVKDEKLATHILGLHQNPDSKKPEIPTDMLKKYIAYARQFVHPHLTPEAIEEIKSFYLKMRMSGSEGGGVQTIPISPRQLEALVRLAEASARMRLSDVVLKRDAKKAIELLEYCLLQVGLDKETGKIDIDRIATGVGASQRNNILIVKEILNDLEARSGKTISIEDVVQEARTRGLDSEKVEEAIEKLRRTGDIFEPRRGFISKL